MFYWVLSEQSVKSKSIQSAINLLVKIKIEERETKTGYLSRLCELLHAIDAQEQCKTQPRMAIHNAPNAPLSTLSSLLYAVPSRTTADPMNAWPLASMATVLQTWSWKNGENTRLLLFCRSRCLYTHSGDRLTKYQRFTRLQISLHTSRTRWNWKVKWYTLTDLMPQELKR